MKYQVPRGTNDVFGEDIKKWQRVEELIRNFCHVYNYEEIRTPIFEHTNVFKRDNDASDMVNKEMYTFQLDNSSTSLTLRPEGTAGVVRSFVENKLYGSAQLPLKQFYIGPQFRHERPQKGRLRMFNQFGVEVIGEKNPLIDVECIALGYSFVKSLGLKKLKVCINTLGDDISLLNYRKALEEYFKGHLDNLCGDCQRRYSQNPLRILDCKVDHESAIIKQVPQMSEYLSEDSKKYFKQVLEGLDALNIPYEVDDRLVRGLDYYTHTVFEVVEDSEKMGVQSTIFAGGRYDGLVSYFGGPDTMSGMGWALGIERLLIACESEGIDLEVQNSLDAYVLCLDKSLLIPCLQIVSTLRANGYSAEMDMEVRSFKAQFKSVERKHAQYAIIVGEKDYVKKEVSIKRINDQFQKQASIDSIVAIMDELYSSNEGGNTHE